MTQGVWKPLRRFDVYITDIEGDVESVEGHMTDEHPTGALHVQRYDEDFLVLWTIRIYAPGKWHHVEAEVPNVEDVRRLVASYEEEQKRQVATAHFVQDTAREIAGGRHRKPSNAN